MHGRQLDPRGGGRGEEVGAVGRSPTVMDSGALLGFSSSALRDTTEDLEGLGACKGRCDTIVSGVNLLEGLVRQAWSEHRERGWCCCWGGGRIMHDILVQVHWEDLGPCSAEDTLKVAGVGGR